MTSKPSSLTSELTWVDGCAYLDGRELVALGVLKGVPRWLHFLSREAPEVGEDSWPLFYFGFPLPTGTIRKAGYVGKELWSFHKKCLDRYGESFEVCFENSQTRPEPKDLIKQVCNELVFIGNYGARFQRKEIDDFLNRLDFLYDACFNHLRVALERWPELNCYNVSKLYSLGKIEKEPTGFFTSFVDEKKREYVVKSGRKIFLKD